MRFLPPGWERLIKRVREGQSSSELQHLPRDELQAIARDLNVSEQDLLSLSARDAGESDLLYHRLAALGLSPAHVDRVARGLMRDLERTCACCGDKATCTKDLTDNPEGEGWKSYCLNADTLVAVAGTKGRFPA